MRVFLSHTHADREFARKLASDLKEAGFDVFTYLDAISPGESIAERIGAEILQSQAVIILLSQASAQNPWVISEIALVRASRESGSRHRIIPIVIEQNVEIPFFIKDLLYLDLSDSDRYRDNFLRLTRALQQVDAERPERREGQKARERMLRAREMVLVLEKEFHHEQSAMRQHFISIVIGIATIASLFVGLASVLAIIYIKISWPLLAAVSISFFLGMFIPFFLFMRYRRQELDRLAKLRSNLRATLSELTELRGEKE